MQICIGAVGHLKSGPEADLVDQYVQRFNAAGQSLGLRNLKIHEVSANKALKTPARIAREADLLQSAMSPGAAVFILDEHGKTAKSQWLASELGRLKDTGERECWFLIGGADGHDKDLLNRAGSRKISFGAATWPHMLVRAMLCEQLYRAVTIISGHPYHRE